jgi:hypothetical protein
MTRNNFSKLSEPIQYRLLLLRGVCVAERMAGDVLLLLFQIDSFYVEIAFDNYSDEVLSARSFEDTTELAPYLNNILPTL